MKLSLMSGWYIRLVWWEDGTLVVNVPLLDQLGLIPGFDQNVVKATNN